MSKQPRQGALDASVDGFLREAFEDAPFEFWVRDADDRCVLQNAAAREWGDLNGERTDESDLPAEVTAAWRENNRRAFAGELVQNEFEVCRGGVTRYFRCVVVPIREAGHVRTILGFNLEITDRKRAETALRESERRLREALRVGRMGYLDWDLVTNEIRWSPETYRLFGYDPATFTPTIEATVGMVPPEDLPFVQSRLDAVIAGSVEYDIYHRVVRGDGKTIHIHAQGEVMRDAQGKAVRMLGTVSDVTERMLAEEALREADRRRSDFLGVLSHELRNPLAPIRNCVYVLERATPGGDQARKALAVIDRQVTHLTRLIDDLLDITRISSGKVRLQRARLNLVDLVGRAVDDHRTLLAGREVTLDLPTRPVWIQGDATRISQMVGNLLSNAAKFTLEKARIGVTLTEARGDAVLEVADTGLGIDADTLGRLFVPFVQSDRSLDRSPGGLGLGLALVRALAELHGGSVTARSEGPQRGACFTIRLPLDVAPDAALEPEAKPGVQGGTRKVLVIEDNRDGAEALSMALKLLGHDVTVAFDGTEGLAKAHEVKPDVIVCDVGLPGIVDGYRVARSLRDDADLASAYRVALTGYAQPEDQAKAQEAGFDVHLAKPADMNVLERLVAKAPTIRR